MLPFLVLCVCDLLDAVKHKSLAGKPKADCLIRGRWWLRFYRRGACLVSVRLIL